MRQALVTDIQKFAVHDGPGIRTLVFLKGCPLRCSWCHNPETQLLGPEIYWKSRFCEQCGDCLKACPHGAVLQPIVTSEARSDETSYHKIIRERCTRCMACVEACQYDALSIVGKPMTVDEVLDEVEKDRPFYNNSGGGLTLSGGEPTLHADFALQIVRGAKQRNLHVCLDTCGFCRWDSLERMLEHVDLVIFDLKHTDTAVHQTHTGVGNETILENLSRLARTTNKIWIRIPVIPGFNNTSSFHTQAAEFLSQYRRRISRVDLLPFHNWCQDKYRWLGIDWPLKRTESLEPAYLELSAEMYRANGLETTIGGSGFEKSAKSVA